MSNEIENETKPTPVASAEGAEGLEPHEPQAEPAVEELPRVVMPPRPPRRNLGAGKPVNSAGEAPPPSRGQFTESRAAHWHQAGNPLLSVDALKDWLNRAGLVFYAPRAQALGAPAPTFVEATLGRASGVPEPAELETARNLLARLIAEGAAVPLNLLGVTGAMGTDTPDFVASAAVFSYVFTLRGNKAWKTPPVTAGPVKVSPLALATYEILTAKVTLSAYDLATQLGKEVTEAAVLRSLTELWSQLRVIPVPHVDAGGGHDATLWELTSSRFTRQIKSGANAGQPSALSALISLYLGQVRAAEEAEIETFLSPLAARSRVRDVVHALLGARQLETIVLDGKTLLHVAGELPAFAAAAPAQAVAGQPEEAAAEAGSGSRISKFAGRPGSKIGTGLRAKTGGAGRGFGAKPAFGRGRGGERASARPPGAPAKPERERRPFIRREGDGGARPPSRKPAFDRPWDEGKAREGQANDAAASPRTFSKPGTFARKRDGAGTRPGAERSAGAARPPRPARPAAAGGFQRAGAYPSQPSRDSTAGSRGQERGERREFKPRPAFGNAAKFDPGRRSPARGEATAAPGGEAIAPKRVFRKFDAPRAPRPAGSRAGFAAKPSGAKPFAPRPSRAAGSAPGATDARPERTQGDRPFSPPRRVAGSGERPERPSRSGQGASGGREREPRSPRGEGRPSFGSRGASAGKPGFSARPGSSDKPSFGGRAGARPGKSFAGPRQPGSFAGPRQPGSFAGPRQPGSFAASGSTFAKFADGKKPFRKPGPGKPSGGSRTGKPGGFSPVKRKRPEDGE